MKMNILNFKRLSASTQVVARTLSNIKKEKTNLSNGIKSDSNAFTVLENYNVILYLAPVICLEYYPYTVPSTVNRVGEVTRDRADIWCGFIQPVPTQYSLLSYSSSLSDIWSRCNPSLLIIILFFKFI